MHKVMDMYAYKKKITQPSTNELFRLQKLNFFYWCEIFLFDCKLSWNYNTCSVVYKDGQMQTFSLSCCRKKNRRTTWLRSFYIPGTIFHLRTTSILQIMRHSAARYFFSNGPGEFAECVKVGHLLFTLKRWEATSQLTLIKRAYQTCKSVHFPRFEN